MGEYFNNFIKSQENIIKKKEEEDEYKRNTYYKYNDCLNNIETLKDLEYFKSVFLIIYSVNTTGKYPFLEFGLFKTSKLEGDMLFFPKIFTSNGIEIIEKSDKIINYLLKSTLYKYKGYNNYLDDLYLFVDATEINNEFSAKKVMRNDKLWFVLPCEIINYNKSCGFLIDSSVFNFFDGNFDYLFLFDEDLNKYETPDVGYISSLKDKLNFLSIFGPLIEPEGCVGSYYYFSNYTNAIKENGMDGIIKFALFLGIVNQINEENKKIIDKKCNSFYIGKSRTRVIKDYNQFVPLCLHTIDKRNEKITIQ